MMFGPYQHTQRLIQGIVGVNESSVPDGVSGAKAPALLPANGGTKVPPFPLQRCSLGN